MIIFDAAIIFFDADYALLFRHFFFFFSPLYADYLRVTCRYHYNKNVSHTLRMPQYAIIDVGNMNDKTAGIY